MPNHPNRGRSHSGRTLTGEELRDLRLANGHSFDQAGAVIFTSGERWEECEKNQRRMHPAFTQLYRIKTDPAYAAAVLGLNALRVRSIR